jgi:hypothetical protein
VRLEAESYGDHETASFINESFVPFTANLHEKAGLFGRFGAAWTPTIIILSPRGAEVYRIEGYLPRDSFRAELEMALARVEFMGKQFQKAERWYDHIVSQHPSHAAEAMYWRAVSRYSASHDPTPLMEVAKDLQAQQPNSVWATKASVWMPAESTSDKASVM